MISLIPYKRRVPDGQELIQPIIKPKREERDAEDGIEPSICCQISALHDMIDPLMASRFKYKNNYTLSMGIIEFILK